jgi:hypothetical protein
MKPRVHCLAPLAFACGTLFPGAAAAGLTVLDDGPRQVKIGGRVQAQYVRADPDGRETTDDFRIRRAWLTFDASATEHWHGRLQFQLNGGLSTKDAKIRYTGWDAATLTVGNFYVPFSREELTSTKRQQLVEKTSVAGTGSPGRGIGLALAAGGGATSWTAGVWEIGMDRDTGDIDFGSQIDGRRDYEGRILAARFELHPDGDIGFGQGNLDGQSAWEIAVNGFSWSNDDDAYARAGASAGANPRDYETVSAIGIDGAWRAGGWSVDAEVNAFTAETNGSTVTSGIVDNGEAQVHTMSIEGGYLLVPARWELVGSYSTEDADAWAETETQAGIGINRFFSGHANKLQLSLVQTSDAAGTLGNDRTDLYVQLQHAF